MARVAADRLNDVREAIALYNQVLALEERDADALPAWRRCTIASGAGRR
jgi:hypothetical protein